MTVKPLVLTAKAFVKMIKWMAEYANFTTIMTPNWVEAMGVMFCRETSEKYIIADAAGITYGNLVYVETSPQQVAEIVRIEESLKQVDQSIFAGGWFHSHPGHGLFFSGTDIGNQSYWQSGNPNGVGLVFDLTLVSETDLGFKFFRLDDSQQFFEVPYELHGFNEETLIEAFKPIGIEPKTIRRLAKYLKLKITEGIVEFDKIQLPKTDEPVSTAKNALSMANEEYLKGHISKALEQYRIANLLLKNTSEKDLYIDTTLTLAKLCILNDYPETGMMLIEDIMKLSKGTNNSGIIEARARILLGYQAEFDATPSKALEQYKLALDLFKQESYLEGSYEAAELAGGASWKLIQKNEAIDLFKLALKFLDQLPPNESKHSSLILKLKKIGLEAKINDAESSISESGIDKVV